MGYLDGGSYLGEGEFLDGDARGATSELFPALGDDATSTEMITLPGGIVMPKKTFWAIVVLLAVITLIVIVKKRRAAAAETA
jgi:hypothetical protein